MNIKFFFLQEKFPLYKRKEILYNKQEKKARIYGGNKNWR